ncbi:MEDS domain-containing protein [Actinoplanes sp. NPDC051411]|uniref:MEDS domain-containing protein n=1 Tax=Actinoplanes sp. NPDC051411 TaxID=3155522 RepID=UPI00341DABE2
MRGTGLLDRLTIGDHICWLVDDDRLRMREIAGFVRAGLRDHHRVVYCGDCPDVVLACIDEQGIDTATALAGGQLEATTAEACYLAAGVFEPESALRLWEPMARAARTAGYTGVRVLGDMSWAGRGVPGREHLCRYESQINRVVLNNELIGVCAYDRRTIDPLELRRLAWQHPGIAASGAPYDERLALRIRRTRRPAGLVLSGEADLAGRNALRAVVENVFVDCGADEVTVDVGGLRFADRAAARILVRAGHGAGRVRLVGCSPALLRLLAFTGAGDAPRLTVVPA